MTKQEFIQESTMRNVQSLLPILFDKKYSYEEKDISELVDDVVVISIHIANITADKLYKKSLKRT